MKQINEDIRQGNLKQIYLLHGKERYLCRQYKERLKEAFRGGNDDTMNTHFFEGRDIPMEEILTLAETLPFLSPRRVIFITDSGWFKSGGDRMSEYLNSPNETTYFVFTESEVDKRCKLYKTVQSKGYAAEFDIQSEATLKRWIANLLSKEGKKITENTILLFLSKTGTDMTNIRMELEKLISYCLDRDVITDTDVEMICTTQVSNHIFDMIDAIALKQQKRALDLYYDLLALNESPIGILTLITRHCNMLLQAKGMRANGYDIQAISEKLTLKRTFFVKKYLNQASRFPIEALRGAVEQCVEMDTAIKSGRIDKMIGVEILITTIL